ncbi:glycosyltransferase family 4 protein [Streptomyces sp. NBC_00445]|uniref:glycosyltransferase family 4 protein n=1 Tax=unclassified Streptomyces TaxID=2593676 RepID=UPI002E2201DC|nr:MULTISPECIES: glycosyltransferase family 4 protein [unclassified Streptomyces]
MPGDADGRPTVLHVAEAWQGGVQAIVYDYVRAVPEARHLLLKGDREGYQVADEETAFAGVWRMPPGHLARIREVGRLYRELRPDVVHAHSSMAGGYVRLAASVPTRRIVYTPHGFAMERSDLSWYASAAVWTAERVLSRRTGIAAGSSPRETELARLLRKRQRTVYVPNVVRPRTGPGTSDAGLPSPTVAAVGRLCTQKDPAFFADAAAEGRRLMPSSNWYWLGGGEPAHRERLERAGVTVTGWLDHHDLQRLLAQADVYAHTALWEGAPMTLLEAVGLGRPVVARRIPALESLGLPGLVDTPAELAAEAVALLKDGPSKGAEERMAELFVEHSPERQRTMLRHVYGH